jgi:very-short-patch-repair endonuclease
MSSTHKNKAIDYHRAKELRSNSSPYENKLWRALQHLSQTTKIKFRRQQPLHPYIADFVCMKAKLIVEVDGASHDRSVDYDLRRTAYLEYRGYHVLRFSNQDVAKNLQHVVDVIFKKVTELLEQQVTPNAPSPSLAKGRIATQAKLSSPARGEE